MPLFTLQVFECLFAFAYEDPLSGLDTMFNIFLAVGIVLSSAVFMTVGALGSIPTAMLTDYLLHDQVLPPVAVLGAVLVVLGFVLFVWADGQAKRKLEEDALELSDVLSSRGSLHRNELAPL